MVGCSSRPHAPTRLPDRPPLPAPTRRRDRTCRLTPSAAPPSSSAAPPLLALFAGPLGLDAADERLRTAFLVGVETADALLQLAFRTDPAGDPALVAETKLLLRAYLARYPDGAGAGEE
ncbi:hypothetical protein ACWCO0_24215 [Streptomyces tubercidicus]